MNRQEDLSKVFDRTWKANHNDVAKREREKEKVFIDKMFGVNKNNEKAGNMRLTPNMVVSNQKKNIDGVANFQRKTQTNNIIKKWK